LEFSLVSILKTSATETMNKLGNTGNIFGQDIDTPHSSEKRKKKFPSLLEEHATFYPIKRL
jgi:hypothetical protein